MLSNNWSCARQWKDHLHFRSCANSSKDPWELTRAKCTDVFLEHTDGQFEEGKMCDAMRYFSPAFMEKAETSSEAKIRIQEMLWENFRILKLREELSKYLCCACNMGHDDIVKSWTTPPGTNVLPNLSAFILELMCFTRVWNDPFRSWD
eukprot:TRINITY_DN1642_c0_g6_i1.p1 TRINITY_DN1642_c0_g6~~TRINITY_DN1642_c0_g6_i1.p1  ORF type:complete len:149 (+),score=35.30 TRINITY_DN1642_c0_g6_i1:1396-1842(+)